MSIRYLENRRMWILETRRTAYVFAVNDNNRLQHVYWNNSLPYDSDYADPQTAMFWGGGVPEHPVMHPSSLQSVLNLEYPTHMDGLNYHEPCLKLCYHDGVRDCRPDYVGHTQQDDHLTVELSDEHYGLAISLHYRVIDDCDLIDRWVEIRNLSKHSIDLETVMSAALHMPRGRRYRMSHVTGRWVGEFQIRRDLLTEGKKVIESRRGFTSHESNPWCAIDACEATEESGEVWFAALHYSGNWRMTAELGNYNRMALYAGVHDFDFRRHLEPGDAFTTPAVSCGFTQYGFGQMSRNLHQYQLDHILPREHARTMRKILYNSWEATAFAINESDQMKLADRAASIGVEMFVVDDGWFGKRNGDNAGLGDWYVNREKFPNGLSPLIDHIHGLGMDFGLWVEPEMVNPDSDLYRMHPDWVYHFPNRQRTEARNQLVLNFCRNDVCEYIHSMLSQLLTDFNIDFIKWDFNRAISEPGYPACPIEHQREVWVRHVDGLYAVLDRLKAKFPRVLIETCASGGGRVDLGILKRTDQAWTSDNTDAFDRLKIQEGFSLAYCPKVMMAWVTDSPTGLNKRTLSLDYRFHSAMMGSLGIGGNLNHWSDLDMARAKHHITTYKSIRHIVQEGRLYRLLSPRDSNLAAVQYVTADKRESVIFAMLHSLENIDMLPVIHPRGLQDDQRYTIDHLGTFSGKSLMKQGIGVKLFGDFSSTLIHLKS